MWAKYATHAHLVYIYSLLLLVSQLSFESKCAQFPVEHLNSKKYCGCSPTKMQLITAAAGCGKTMCFWILKVDWTINMLYIAVLCVTESETLCHWKWNSIKSDCHGLAFGTLYIFTFQNMCLEHTSKRLGSFSHCCSKPDVIRCWPIFE